VVLTTTTSALKHSQNSRSQEEGENTAPRLCVLGAESSRSVQDDLELLANMTGICDIVYTAGNLAAYLFFGGNGV